MECAKISRTSSRKSKRNKIQGHTEGMIEVIKRMNNLGISIELIEASVDMNMMEIQRL